MPTQGSDESDPDPIPLSALQHAAYCLRQAALIHLERLWAENRLTAEGRVLHLATNDPSGRRVRSVRRVSALPIACHRLGVAGIADLVEFHVGERGTDVPYPIEIKRGRPKPHRADEVQLCGQALCLEEMFGVSVPEGALFYGETRRRLVVRFDPDLRDLTERIAAELRAVFDSRRTPPAEYRAGKCRACSLIDLCQPKAGRRSVRTWRDQEIATLLAPPAP